MPSVERPDGACIHYEVRGEGPLVVLTLGFAATPAVYEGLASDLARDCTVVTWHPRGCGSSTPGGPYDIATDAADHAALIEVLGGSPVVFAVAHGVNITAGTLTTHPGLVHAVVSPGVATALLGHLEGMDGLAASRPVIEMLVEQMRRDPRAAIRATTESLNPQLDEEALRWRVDELLAYTPAEISLARIESWLATDAPLGPLGDLGDRLAVLWHERDTWQAGAIDRIRELLPDARIDEVEDGPLSRPDLAAAAVREYT